jgi:hypothetical protein
MRAKLTAPLAGLVLLGLAGTARAEALTPEAPALTLLAVADTWFVPSTGTQAASSTETQVVALTDTQLVNVAAGEWRYLGWTSFRYYSNNQWHPYYAPLWVFFSN